MYIETIKASLGSYISIYEERHSNNCINRNNLNINFIIY